MACFRVVTGRFEHYNEGDEFGSYDGLAEEWPRRLEALTMRLTKPH